MIDLQDIITTKRELLSRETYSRNPINYSAGMAEDQKDRYIQYLAEQNQALSFSRSIKSHSPSSRLRVPTKNTFCGFTLFPGA